jgi:AcrR family transcriptional regulator
MFETTAPTTRRELSKAERRRRIVEAATSLLRESGFEAVSMLQIAERAGVSPATVYNLFQTKAAILQQVFDRDLRDYERHVDQAPAKGALDRIFKAVDIAASLYRDDPGFYRAMAQAGRHKDTLRPAISERRIGFWKSMVAAARDAGSLVPETDEGLLGVSLSQTMRGAFSEWAGGAISAERLAQETCYGFSLALLAYAAADAAAGLRERLRRLEAALAADHRNQASGQEANP